MSWRTVSVVAGLSATLTGARVATQLTQIAGVTCASPPPLHCPEANCPRELIAHPAMPSCRSPIAPSSSTIHAI
jgi:hypothetical protein